MLINHKSTPLPTNWPFPSINGERTKESQELLDSKQNFKTNDDLSDVEEALF